MKTIFSIKYLRYGLFLLAGLFLGWLFFHSPSGKHEHTKDETVIQKPTVWTCAMHPQIRMDKPGKCPLCGMDLIPLDQNSSSAVDPDAIYLTKEAAQLANVLVTKAERSKPVKELRLYGKVQADERLLQSQVSHIPGRIEKLMVNFTGEFVRRGQTLALVYSPDLVTAQQELLEAVKSRQSYPEIYEASKEKLRQWKLSGSQISNIESSGSVQNDFEVVSNTTGVVINRRVNNGDYISQGTALYDIADLSAVWVMFDAYESDLPFLTKGDKIDFTVQALPGINFTGNITFIDPVIDPVTRVSKVRVEIGNTAGRLKPEMFATGIVKANLNEYRDKIIIPRSAVLWTGKRSIVYVKQSDTDEPVFKMREIETGPMLGNSYVVMSGLTEGEEIVTQGTFSVDAAAQLEGKLSMMNHEPGKASTGFLNSVLDKYVDLKDVLVASDNKKATLAAREFIKSLSGVNMKLLADDDHNKWMGIAGRLDKLAEQIASSDDIEAQRTAFSSISNEFYKSIKSFGLSDRTVYYQYCHMAFNDKGAYWLSINKEIRNPYYGDAMLTCGETKEEMKF